MCIAAATIGSAVIGGAVSSDAARSAGNKQKDASNAALGLQQDQYNQTRADLTPQRAVGYAALNQLQREMGLSNLSAAQPAETRAQIIQRLTPQFTGPQFGNDNMNYGGLNDAVEREVQRQQQEAYDKALAGAPNAQQSTEDVTAQALAEPGYQFGLQQGQQALDRKIAAMGGRVSGAALKAATQFGNDYGSTKYNAAYQRRQDRLNRLSSLAGFGQTATNASSAAGANAANAMSGILQQQGQNAGAANIAQSNIWGNAANQVVGYYQNQQNQQNNQNLLSQLYGGGGYGGISQTPETNGGFGYKGGVGGF